MRMPTNPFSYSSWKPFAIKLKAILCVLMAWERMPSSLKIYYIKQTLELETVLGFLVGQF